jgi:hypothetical protein
VPELRRATLGSPCPPRDPLYQGEVSDGGARIRVWASSQRYGITVTHHVQTRVKVRDEAGYWTGEEFRVNGDTTLSIGGGLSIKQAEALIAELELAVRAKRLADGEPWHGREVAPGVLRAPSTSEADHA